MTSAAVSPKSLTEKAASIFRRFLENESLSVMAGLVPAFHVFAAQVKQDVDARHKADEFRGKAAFHCLHFESDSTDAPRKSLS